MRARRSPAALVLVGLALAGIGAATALAQPPDLPPDEPIEPPIEALRPPEEPPPAMPAPKPAPVAPAPSWQPRAVAELAALDKIDDRSAMLNVPVGQTIQFEHLSIAVRACVVRGPDQAPNAAAFLQIADGRGGAPGFSGWILAAEPSVSMLQHPAYDVRVVGCR